MTRIATKLTRNEMVFLYNLLIGIHRVLYVSWQNGEPIVVEKNCENIEDLMDKIQIESFTSRLYRYNIIMRINRQNNEKVEFYCKSSDNLFHSIGSHGFVNIIYNNTIITYDMLRMASFNEMNEADIDQIIRFVRASPDILEKYTGQELNGLLLHTYPDKKEMVIRKLPHHNEYRLTFTSLANMKNIYDFGASETA